MTFCPPNVSQQASRSYHSPKPLSSCDFVYLDLLGIVAGGAERRLQPFASWAATSVGTVVAPGPVKSKPGGRGLAVLLTAPVTPHKIQRRREGLPRHRQHERIFFVESIHLLHSTNSPPQPAANPGCCFTRYECTARRREFGDRRSHACLPVAADVGADGRSSPPPKFLNVAMTPGLPQFGVRLAPARPFARLSWVRATLAPAERITRAAWVGPARRRRGLGAISLRVRSPPSLWVNGGHPQNPKKRR